MADQLKGNIHIGSLPHKKFMIPHYQRGYKWKPKDVRYLIEDLTEFRDEKPYYMQPIVVVEKDGKMILVDGQQRLTTFFLIWRKLHSMRDSVSVSFPNFSETDSFTLEYEKRPESTDYLSFENPYKSKDKPSPDVRNFKNAEREMERLLKELEEDDKKRFLDNFFNKATFLWYELADPVDGPKTFERLNGKRIALTDVELCKVLLLSDSCTTKTQRNDRSAAWQNIEYRLQDDEFYAFLVKEFKPGHDLSRMGFLLDLVLEDSPKEKDDYLDYPLLSRLKKDIFRGRNVWNKIIQTFHRLELLFDNPLHYNLVGFLVGYANTPLKDIVKESVNPEFGSLLVKRIRNWVGNADDLRNLEYKNGKTYAALVLFNILCDLTVNDNPQSERIEDRFGFIHRFRFDLLKGEKFDKEHVHATNSRKPASAIEWQQWAKNILRFLPKETLQQLNKEGVKDLPAMIRTLEEVSQIIADSDNGDTEEMKKERLTDSILKVMNKKTFDEIYEVVNSNLLKEKDDSDEQQNGIGNMALLNARINRDQNYAAAPFAVKAGIISERVKKGVFVPKGTQIMFDKSFRSDKDEFYHWAKENYANNLSSDTEVFTDYFVETIKKIMS